ncbi:response regulator transcription factor [Gulosibacter molinativorax]|uniref:DNA-binding response regulator n=1 Tax=Gulosibacter molinativorax TaxID=256821 RepID=A0ABT7C4G8_9MICO|nr:response regulator transcription factor [Gulosibacter molinativorax]MDJ1370033.1 DNA-binding response regulator [Gulosibacter molinativorax]QUY63776.1 Transcriptional regulatory protein UhpA [Gulosibacter molinativorax]
MIRVLFADDEELIRTALETLLNLEEDIEIVASCDNGADAVRLAAELQPDVCLFDLEMPGMDGVEAAERILRAVPTRVIIVTRHARPGVLRRALATKVSGFTPKSVSAQQLAEIIRKVAAGGRWVDPEIAAGALVGERSPLTAREADALRVSRSVTTVDEIAKELKLAPGTVRNYLSQAMTKLDARTRHEAAARAYDQGWI